MVVEKNQSLFGVSVCMFFEIFGYRIRKFKDSGNLCILYYSPLVLISLYLSIITKKIKQKDWRTKWKKKEVDVTENMPRFNHTTLNYLYQKSIIINFFISCIRQWVLVICHFSHHQKGGDSGVWEEINIYQPKKI